MTIKHRIQAVVLIILCGIGTATANNKLKLLPRVTPPLVSQDQPAAELELSSAELEASPAALEASLAAWDESPVDLEESPFADDSLQETDLVPAAAETCGDCCDGYGPCDGCGSCDGCGPCDGGDQPDGQDQCEH
ncbi:MAG: hypothetical protein GTO53_04020, partial [Planctomycetales bacterium]|nr:hypothetical protein [Planctomycetales bacterium]NIM08326.1 hypothetical protein [Planctomycetales bacterium]NIO34119.1 hypothetical protein [Planctomycetales bacterium]NIO45917.1 hypothetical protein [Planctomycetales bacterium]NIP68667.1 hypothetical protein [Planctomycetales bacterium]